MLRAVQFTRVRTRPTPNQRRKPTNGEYDTEIFLQEEELDVIAAFQRQGWERVGDNILEKDGEIVQVDVMWFTPIPGISAAVKAGLPKEAVQKKRKGVSETFGDNEDSSWEV